VVYIPGAVSHVDFIWDDPERARFFERLSRSCRLIIFDKRGTGASDSVGVADLETRIDDVRAVMDAAGSSRAAVVGVSEGGPMALLFAAAHPDRVAALVIYGRFLALPGRRIFLGASRVNAGSRSLRTRFAAGEVSSSFANGFRSLMRPRLSVLRAVSG